METIKYTVSSETSMLLDLLQKQDRLFSDITAVLTAIYGIEQVECIMNRDFYKPLSELRDEIYQYLRDSVDSNLGTINSTTI